MADYYSILKKTISGLPSNTPDTRKLVYSKARSAIDRQLRAVQPLPSEAVIERQMSALEESIDRLEEEFSAPADWEVTEEPEEFEPEYEPQSYDSMVDEDSTVEAEEPAPPPFSRQYSAPQQPSARPDIARPDEQAYPPQAGRQDYSRPAYDSSLDVLDDVDEPVDVIERGLAGTKRRPKRGSGRAATVIISLILVALIGVGGYAIWLNREPLMAAIGMDQPATTMVPEPDEEEPATTVEESAPEADEGKETARLGEDGKTVSQPLEPEQPVANPPALNPTAANEDAQVRVVDPPSEEPSPVDTVAEEDTDTSEPIPGAEPDATDSDSGDTVEEDTVEADNTADSGDDVAEPEPAAAPPVPAIGQKAFLYEEGVGNAAATRDNAAIVWSLVQEPPGEGLPPEAVVKGEFEVPGRGLDLTLTIKRNIDEALSASHIIELVFDAPPDFSGGGIDKLSGFVPKANEQARGEPLVAVPVKIDTNFFMIALNNLDQAKETNKRLMLDSKWIDIPLVYTSGRRSLIAIEKGAIGEKVFQDAFADWDKR